MDAGKISVVLEQALHDQLTRLLQDFEARHGVRVNSVEATWINVSTTGAIQSKHLLHELTLNTTTGGN